MQKVQTSNAN